MPTLLSATPAPNEGRPSATEERFTHVVRQRDFGREGVVDLQLDTQRVLGVVAVDDLQAGTGVPLFEQLLEGALEEYFPQLARPEAHCVGEASQVHRTVEELADLLWRDAVVELENFLVPILGVLPLLRQKEREDVIALLVLQQSNAELRAMVALPVPTLDVGFVVDDVIPVTVVRKKDRIAHGYLL